jgi:uncharacterized protein GlcG (DUF336 family)
MANVVKKHSISTELAQKMVDQAVAKAREIGVSENVAILDDGGNLKAFSRMDGSPILSIEIAQNKAYTALFGVSTQDFFNFFQGEALGKWGIRFKGSYDYLSSIQQPTLIVNGGNDVIIYAVNSFILQQHLPNAELILYPDAITARSTSIPNCSSSMSRCSCRRTDAGACEDRKRSRYPPQQQRGR